jgi:hypothetical protein
MARPGPKEAHRRWSPDVLVSVGIGCWNGSLAYQDVHFGCSLIYDRLLYFVTR